MLTDRMPGWARRILADRRARRITFALSKVTTRPNMTVLDVGCGRDGRSFEDHIPVDWHVTGVDLFEGETSRHRHPHFRYTKQNAQRLMFDDNEFDLAVSIGMLEHIVDEMAFRCIVSEIRRVARQHIVIVPYRYCWVEPHYGVPLFPIWPYWAKIALVKLFNLCGHREIVKADPLYIKKNFIWPSNAEYRRVFPDSEIHFMPTKETIAIIRKE